MKKAIWLLLLALLLACGPSTTDSLPAVTGTEEDTAVTSTEETAEETAETTETTESTNMAATNLDDFSPAGTVAEAAVAREQDWRKGAADPDVLIIEYGDFQ
jgi:hypothetical protein